jgi:hypothetical protein
MNTLSSTVSRRIGQRALGAVFSNRDFLDLGARSAVDQSLVRLTRRGVIRRLSQGLYDRPRVHPVLGALSPSPDAVAKAVADRNLWRIVPSGAYAANQLGLTTQVPAKIVYYTDGNDCKVQIDSLTIEFRHASPRRMAGAGKISGIVIAALRHLGKDNIDDTVIQKLKTTLTVDDRQTLMDDILLAPDWLRGTIRQIAQ